MATAIDPWGMSLIHDPRIEQREREREEHIRMMERERLVRGLSRESSFYGPVLPTGNFRRRVERSPHSYSTTEITEQQMSDGSWRVESVREISDVLGMMGEYSSGQPKQKEAPSLTLAVDEAVDLDVPTSPKAERHSALRAYRKQTR
jgi:hypothetical protein